MSQLLYRQGALVPENPCDLPDGAKVLISIHQDSMLTPPEVAEPEERTRILRELVGRMRRNPVPHDAPRFTRDEMHDRG